MIFQFCTNWSAFLFGIQIDDGLAIFIGPFMFFIGSMEEDNETNTP